MKMSSYANLSLSMNNGFYVEVYKLRLLMMYNVLQVYRISCNPIFITCTQPIGGKTGRYTKSCVLYVLSPYCTSLTVRP